MYEVLDFNSLLGECFGEVIRGQTFGWWGWCMSLLCVRESEVSVRSG